MSKITFIENAYKTNPSFRDSEIKGYYCFGPFKNTEYFEICTISKNENESENNKPHYRQVIDIDREQAIFLINELIRNFTISKGEIKFDKE